MMRRFILALFLIAVIAGGIAAYYFYSKTPEKRNFITLYGNVDVRQVDLGFRVKGRVDQMVFEEGDFVPSGTLMAQLNQQPYTDEWQQAVAAVDSNRMTYKNAEKLLKRRLELIGDGSVSQEDLDNAQTSKDVAEQNLAGAEAALRVAESNVSFTQLYAPADGTILTRIREPGTAVVEAQPIYTLSLVSPVWIRAYVTEPDLGLIYPGMIAEIMTDTPNGQVYKGHVGFISPVAEFTPKTVETTQLRTDLVYRLRVIANNPDKGLRQGMPVTVKLSLEGSGKDHERR